jgi:hypothetical protein
LPAAGNNGNITLDPSRGGNGIILKIKKLIFIVTKNLRIDSMSAGIKVVLIKIPAIIAIIKLLRGPTKATNAIDLLPPLSIFTFIGTGLAAQNTTGDLVMISSKGKAKVVNPSICLSGFRLNLPSLYAVGSPNL